MVTPEILWERPGWQGPVASSSAPCSQQQLASGTASLTVYPVRHLQSALLWVLVVLPEKKCNSQPASFSCAEFVSPEIEK